MLIGSPYGAGANASGIFSFGLFGSAGTCAKTAELISTAAPKALATVKRRILLPPSQVIVSRLTRLGSCPAVVSQDYPASQLIQPVGVRLYGRGGKEGGITPDSGGSVRHDGGKTAASV